ncbi:MAG TPA: hypothetical protein VGI15_00165, partial [Candidatus Cybelea sp.]
MSRNRRSRARFRPPPIVTIAAFGLVLSACGGVAGNSQPVPVGWLAELPAAHYRQIHHVVVVVQENRSVDNLFAGFPGARTRPYGFNRLGEKITLRPVPLEAAWDFQHNSTS